MNYQRVGAMVLLAASILPAVHAGQKISVEGAISAIGGTRIELYGGLVKIETAGARIDTEDPNFKNLSDLRVGTFVDVEAVVESGGALRAVRVEVNDEKTQDNEMSGVIGSVDSAAQTFTIGPFTISWNGKTKLKDILALRAGLKVEAKIDFTSGRFVAELIERDE